MDALKEMWLDEAIRPRTTVHMFNDGDVLFTCDLR